MGDLVVSEKVRRRILKFAKVQSDSCLFNIVYCLSIGALQAEGKEDSMDSNKVDAVAQAVGICDCWDSLRDVLHLLFPDVRWPDWRVVLAAATVRLKDLPEGKSDRFYRKRVKELIKELEDEGLVSRHTI